MKKLFFLLIIFTTVLTTNAQDWIFHKSLEFEFSSAFPDEPTYSTQKVQSVAGELTMHMFMLDMSMDLSRDNLIYSVIMSEYPETYFDNPTDEFNKSVLDGAVNGAVVNVKGDLLFADEITFNGFPGRKIKIEITEGFIYMNAYLVNNLIYITQAICLKDKDENKNIDRFFNSFELIRTKH